MGVATQKKQLPIQAILRVLDQRKFNLYSALAKDESDRKELERMLGYILPRWMSGAVNEEDHQRLIIRFNRLANLGYHTLSKHPELQAKLLATVGLGREVKHNFFKANRASKTPLLDKLLRQQYPDLRKEEMRLWCRLNGASDIKRIAEACSWSEEDVEAVVGEYKKTVTEQT
jgi:DNA-binding HxlR family transcriptional regulator